MTATTQTFTANGVVHFELASPNVQNIGDFYTKIFGWTIESKGPGYSIVKTPDGSINGGLTQSETTHISFAVAVSDLDKSLTDVTNAGGKIVLPKTDNGWVTKAQVLDPAGNHITLIELRDKA